MWTGRPPTSEVTELREAQTSIQSGFLDPKDATPCGHWKECRFKARTVTFAP